MADNGAAIAAVNHWRGQCLDSFARVERAVIVALEKLSSDEGQSLLLHETAAQRTKQLCAEMERRPAADSKAKLCASYLQNWSLRERPRNQLVHGCYTVKAGEQDAWSFVNESTEVKKGIAVVTGTPWTNLEAEAFRQSVANERKRLLNILKELELT
jgi:hypothetical protein